MRIGGEIKPSREKEQVKSKTSTTEYTYSSQYDFHGIAFY